MLPKEHLLIGLSQETLQTQEHTGHVVHRTPLVLQYVQADSSGEVNIRMVYGRFEEYGGWSVGISVWKDERELEDEVGVWSLCGSGDRRSPGEKVIWIIGEGRDPRGGRHHQLHELCLEAGGKGQEDCTSRQMHRSKDSVPTAL